MIEASSVSFWPIFIEGVPALSEGLPRHRPFIDGNKRTAFDAVFASLATDGAPPVAQMGRAGPTVGDATNGLARPSKNLGFFGPTRGPGAVRSLLSAYLDEGPHVA